LSIELLIKFGPPSCLLGVAGEPHPCCALDFAAADQTFGFATFQRSIEPLGFCLALLFGVTLRCERQRDETIAKLIATIDEFVRANIRAVRCSRIPAVRPVMAVHRPHYFAAKAARRGR